VLLGPGGLFTSHFGFSWVGFSGAGAGVWQSAGELNRTLAARIRSVQDTRDMESILLDRFPSDQPEDPEDPEAARHIHSSGFSSAKFGPKGRGGRFSFVPIPHTPRHATL